MFEEMKGSYFEKFMRKEKMSKDQMKEGQMPKGWKNFWIFDLWISIFLGTTISIHLNAFLAMSSLLLTPAYVEAWNIY